jgi:PAS domain S-box-containing protein/excisionase family DNA binding protein
MHRLAGSVAVAEAAQDEPRYLTISEVAALLGVSRVSVWRWVRDGRLPASRLGRRTVRIRRDALERALAEGAHHSSQSWDGQHPATGMQLEEQVGPEDGWSWDTQQMAGSEHIVQLYETDASLLDAVAGFIGAALRAGDAGIVVATQPHRDGLQERLRAQGLDMGDGRYVALDATETLSRFMGYGMPDPARFADVIGGVVEGAARGGRRVRVFGEMVALLVADRNQAAAVRLEELWNDLLERLSFSLFCAYPMEGLIGAPFAELVDDVCARHSRVIPGESYTALLSSDDRLRAVAVLQQKAASLEAEIAQRDRAEQKLRRKEAELRDFLEHAVVGLHWVGADGTILWANRAELDMLGYTAEEYIGHHISEFHVDRDASDEMLKRLAGKETLEAYEARLRCRDGAIKHVVISSNVLWDGDTFVHTRCFTMDVTGPKLAEQRLAVQYAMTRTLAEAERLAEAAAPILRCVCETLGWEAGEIWLVDGDTNVLRCQEFWHTSSVDVAEFGAISREMTLAPESGLPGRVWASGQPLWIANVLQDDKFPRASYAARAGLHAAFAFPIQSEGEVLGILEFFSREIRQPDEELLAMMAAIGGQIGQFIQRKRAEEELRQQADRLLALNAAQLRASRQIEAGRDAARRLSAIVESSNDAIFGKTLEGIVTSWNRAAEKLYGYRAEEMVGESVARIIPPGRADELPNILARLRRGERIEHYETVRRHKDGSLLDVSVTISPVMDAKGRISAASVIARDVSERRRAEAERARLLQSEQAARAVAEAALRARDEFLAAAAHDLKTPLTIIKGTALLLQRHVGRTRRNGGDRVTSGLESIDATATQMAAQIDELLDLTRDQLGEALALQRQPTNLVSLAQRVTAAQQQSTQRHSIRFEAAVEELLGTWDVTRVARALDNLLSNAIKYSPRGGEVVVTVRREDDAAGRWAVLEVRDPGMGIPEADLPRIFERFHRAGNVAGEITGSGIGLSSAREVIVQHGGYIAVATREGEGSTFTVRLPLTPHDGASEDRLIQRST